jgi:hypothetical protein
MNQFFTWVIAETTARTTLEIVDPAVPEVRAQAGHAGREAEARS